jgi:arylsulfatase A-like enzyme
MQGRSLWPILSGTADASQHRDDVFSEYYQAIPGGYRTSPNHRAHATCVRSRDYMLAVYHGEDIGELYDLKKDPGEVRNLWDDPAYVAVKAAMLKRLCERMGETIDPLPSCVAPY